MKINETSVPVLEDYMMMVVIQLLRFASINEQCLFFRTLAEIFVESKFFFNLF